MKAMVVVLALGTAAWSLNAVAQDGGDQRMGPPPGRGGKPPIESALDADSNGVIDADELANASAALRKLDKNGDGKLSADEYRPPMPPKRDM